jgi:hypothetical protein
MRTQLFLIAIAIVASGCGATFNESALRERAAFDLSCPRDQLQVQALGSNSAAGVTGCGRKATYVNDAQGVWVKNNEVPVSQPAQTTAASVPAQ